MTTDYCKEHQQQYKCKNNNKLTKKLKRPVLHQLVKIIHQQSPSEVSICDGNLWSFTICLLYGGALCFQIL